MNTEKAADTFKIMPPDCQQTVYYGPKAIEALDGLLDPDKYKGIVLVTGPTLHKKEIDRPILDCLEASKIPFSVFSDTEADPSIATVESIARLCLATKADLVIAFGGGSPMDAAKAAAVLAVYGKDAADYEGGGKVPGPVLPLIAIPTTAGTGSETTSFAVITDPTRQAKMTIASPYLIPETVILDPAFLAMVPQRTAAFCGMDALIHALESYLSKAADPISLAFSKEALARIGGSLQTYVDDRKDEKAALEMLIGSYLAGRAFNRARLGNVHALSHPLSAYFHLPHGMANALLLPAVLEFNEESRFGQLEKLIFGDSSPAYEPGAFVKKIRALNQALGIPASLKEAGVDPSFFEVMAKDAMQSGNVLVNPRKTSLEDLIEIYRQAY